MREVSKRSEGQILDIARVFRDPTAQLVHIRIILNLGLYHKNNVAVARDRGRWKWEWSHQGRLAVNGSETQRRRVNNNGDESSKQWCLVTRWEILMNPTHILVVRYQPRRQPSFRKASSKISRSFIYKVTLSFYYSYRCCPPVVTSNSCRWERVFAHSRTVLIVPFPALPVIISFLSWTPSQPPLPSCHVWILSKDCCSTPRCRARWRWDDPNHLEENSRGGSCNVLLFNRHWHPSVHSQFILPFLKIDLKYYDLGLEYRDQVRFQPPAFTRSSLPFLLIDKRPGHSRGSQCHPQISSRR